MKEKVKVVLSDGSVTDLQTWQRIYKLDESSDYIGRHFRLSEQRFQKDIELYDSLVVNELLIRVLDAFREAINCPITLNSFNRSQAHQDELKKDGFKTATYSPHVVKMAADIDTTSDEQTNGWVEKLKGVAEKLGIKIRIGYRQYQKAKQTFIHVDVCPEFYAPGKPYHNQFHPEQWEKAITW